MFLVEYDIIII